MRSTVIGTLVAAAMSLAVPACASAVEVSDPHPSVGQPVVLTAVVSTISHNTADEPAVYVDWDGGACPGDAPAARTAAKGHFRRGMGVAAQGDGTYYDSMPVSARVLIETARQTICFYDAAGALADQITLTGTPRFPAWGDNGPMKRWSLGSGLAEISNLTLNFNGIKPTRFGGAYGIYRCNGKRFWIDPEKLSFDAAGHFSYNGAVQPDNSNNYDAPVPLKFHGRATLKLKGTVGIGQQELKAPVIDRGESAPSFAKGRWGHPVIRVTGSFTAPGFRSHPGTPLCSHRVSYVLSPFGMENDQFAAVMEGQGTARMAVDPKFPNQMSGEDAGVGTPVPQ